MTDKTMPDEIWCNYGSLRSVGMLNAWGGWIDGDTPSDDFDTSYTRTDLLTALREENARYRKALEYYANRKNYDCERPGFFTCVNPNTGSYSFEADEGNRARKALGEQDE